MRYSAASLILAGLLAGCGDGADTTGPAPDFSGAFLFHASMVDADHQITCTAEGTAVIQQSGSTFTGNFTQTGECVGPGGSADNSGSGSLSAGRFDGRAVSFEAAGCRYEGNLVGQPPSGAQGEVTCSISEGGERFDFAGDWLVTRGVASLAVAPDSAGVALDGALQLSATLLGPSGEALTGWQVTWSSSDPAIAAVDAAGRVTGLGLGSVTITA
ncbi:MAG: Ig-like domain-containing protein, partial [Gemmatimonadota bacterium]